MIDAVLSGAERWTVAVGDCREVLVLLLGGGVQSTAMAILAAECDWPIELALHADTGCESTPTTATISELARRLPYPVVSVTTGLRETLMAGRCVIPAWTSGGGQLRRACTRDFKIRPLRRVLRQRGLRGAILALGISIDETGRARSGYAYPLIERGLDRSRCESICRSAGIDARPSSCVCCPYQSRARWAALSPDDRRRAEVIDRAIRHPSGVREACWLYRGRRPLRDCWGDIQQPTLPGMDDGF